jgi:hypothetical protein
LAPPKLPDAEARIESPVAAAAFDAEREAALAPPALQRAADLPSHPEINSADDYALQRAKAVEPVMPSRGHIADSTSAVNPMEEEPGEVEGGPFEPTESKPIEPALVTDDQDADYALQRASAVDSVMPSRGHKPNPSPSLVETRFEARSTFDLPSRNMTMPSGGHSQAKPKAASTNQSGGTSSGAQKIDAPKKTNKRKPRSRKVLDFVALQRAKESNDAGTPHMPSRGQADKDWMRAILPALKPNSWWEPIADDKGLKIKLRWRTGETKKVYPFSRMGKHELQALMEKTYDQQRQFLYDRLLGELLRKRRSDVASRFEPLARNHSVAGR